MPDLKNLTAPAAADELSAYAAAMSPVLGGLPPHIQIGDLNDPFGFKSADLRELEVRAYAQVMIILGGFACLSRSIAASLVFD
jgi:hypothetical protein